MNLWTLEIPDGLGMLEFSHFIICNSTSSMLPKLLNEVRDNVR
jgi:hypothetical protein